MKVLQINTVYGKGSTGKIAKEIHDICIENGIQCLTAHRCYESNDELLVDSIEISSKIDRRIHGVLARLTMFKGCFSIICTLRFLNKAKLFSPDIIHLHNLHGSYINIPLLFRYIKKNNLPVIWTLHDCWPFTAICSHFTIANCYKWKSGCEKCVQKRILSASFKDNTKLVWKLKRKWFTQPSNVQIITPSIWLENLVKQSFLKKYNVETIYNGIDLNVFKPTVSLFSERYKANNKKIVLGVAFGWGYNKGLDVFITLSKVLSDEYKIVLVGTDSEIDKRLPSNIESIHRTSNQKELAGIYTAADVFVNPTREEVLGLVNIEALACGTPVVTFNTGGSPECIDETCGVVIDVDNIDMLKKEIIRICTDNPYNREDCIKYAEKFNKNKMLDRYLALYRSKE